MNYANSHRIYINIMNVFWQFQNCNQDELVTII